MAGFISLILLIINLIIQSQVAESFQDNSNKNIASSIVINDVQPTSLPTATTKPGKNIEVDITENIEEVQPVTTTTTTTSDPWGVAKQISEHTWTMKVGEDDQMASAQDIYEALNNYRRVHGKNTLGWNNSLAEYAQSRSDFFSSQNKLDQHAGFNEYFGNEENMRRIGFNRIGENSSLGYKVSGVHLIEWVFASDVPHNENQLNSVWTNVGIGVNGAAVDLIFGGN